MAKKGKGLSFTTNVVVFCAVFAVWEVLDRITKTYFEGTLAIGEAASGPLPSIFTWTLVHNTGGAWGIFSDATVALGVFALLVSIGVGVFALFFNKGATWIETASLALIVAGGFGNAVDRFAFGYVVDFINFSFIDFPVFNIADIGVTVGMVVFFVALLIRTFREGKTSPEVAGGEVSLEVDPHEASDTPDEIDEARVPHVVDKES